MSPIMHDGVERYWYGESVIEQSRGCGKGCQYCTLAFKRMERVKADKSYAGQALVCAVTFQAIAGHRASSPMVKSAA